MEFKYEDKSLKGGVYQITNTINGKVYRGSAKCFKKRGYQHLRTLENGTHHCKRLQNSFKKYGTDAFVFEVLEVVEGDKLARTTVEQKYLDEYLDNWEMCYNFKKNALENDSPWSATPEESKGKISRSLKGRIFSEETKKKMSESAKGRVAWNKGKTMSVEIRLHMSAVRKGRRHPHVGHNNQGRVFSEETKRKISNALKGNKNRLGGKKLEAFNAV